MDVGKATPLSTFLLLKMPAQRCSTIRSPNLHSSTTSLPASSCESTPCSADCAISAASLYLVTTSELLQSSTSSGGVCTSSSTSLTSLTLRSSSEGIVNPL
ncbi:hypothetical protein F444_18267 [Phytophthora nicotianae P1976]|uniref:Uncharacterized protein n=1 Tax=Phytophthora nicotianae P1976 TaxID=1317066 RepID=A0A080ZC12_PHYNI|nr:hypothetical protein F444_18267 [Phytophthora nicotianae P1976]